MIRPKEKLEERMETPISGEVAAKRAVSKVYERAAKENRKLPIWKNGQVEWIEPNAKNAYPAGT